MQTTPDQVLPEALDPGDDNSHVGWPPAAARLLPPRVFVKRDLLAGFNMLSGLALFGLPLGWLWARLAPVQLMRAEQDGTLVLLPDESFHQADGFIILVLLGFGFGLVAGFAGWLLRERRGPVMMLSVALGCFVAGYLTARVGIGEAAGRYGIAAAVSPGDIVTVPPTLETWWGLIWWPLAAIMCYGLLALANGMDDLGRRLG